MKQTQGRFGFKYSSKTFKANGVIRKGVNKGIIKGNSDPMSISGVVDALKRFHSERWVKSQPETDT